MKRIAFVSERAICSFGDFEKVAWITQVVQLAQHLGRRGYGVDIYTRRDHERAQPIRPLGLNVREISLPAGPPQFVARDQLLPVMSEFGAVIGEHMRRKSSSYDLIHAHSLTSGVAVSELARTLGLPLMTSVSPSCLSALGLADDASATSSPCAVRSDLLHRSDCIVVSGDQDAKSLRSLPSSLSSDMQVMPIGFDPQELRVVGRLAARASLRWHPQHFSIVQFAQIEPADGLEITLRALAEIRRSGIANAQLYLVGGNCESSTAGSSERQRLLGIAHALGVADAVHFTGRVRQDVLRHHYYAADVFVSTAFQGGRAAPVLQAMACGLPVIASAVEDMRSLISDGDNGYLVNTGDIHQLAKHLCELHADGDLRERFGDAGRKLAYARHSWRTISAALADIYERLIRNKASQPLREPSAEPLALEIASAA